MAEAQGSYRVTHKSVFNPAQMRKHLGIADTSFDKFIEHARTMANVDLRKGVAEELTTTLLLPDGNDEQAALTAEIDKVRDSLAFKRITALFNGEGKGSRLEGVRGTAWGWLNSVTEYVDHHARCTSIDNRMQSAWFGAGDALKTKALEMALEI
jgi:hypothetical protein